MKAGTLVCINKRAESPCTPTRSANWNTFQPGVWNPTESLPVDYEFVGYLIEDIEVGKPVRVLRFARNGQVALGVYQSTIVLELWDDGYVTRNSVYSMKIIHQNGSPQANSAGA